MNTLGRHILVELQGCSEEVLSDVTAIEQAMLGAARKADATIINSTFHHFSPFGVSGVVVIQESHLAIHTWPEFGYAAIDVFTCGELVDPWVAYDFLYQQLQAQQGSSMELNRGNKRFLPQSSIEESQGNQQDPETPIKSTRNVWFTEKSETTAFSLKHSGQKLYDAKSPYQRVEIFQTDALGKLLTLDGMVMTTEKDEFTYHEMIAHVPLLCHNNPQSVLIIGGGDGGTAREVLKHNPSKTVLVEIDALVIEACKEHFPALAESFSNPQLETIVGDGIEYLKNLDSDSFDVIIVDSADPVGPGEGLFTESFYKDVYRCLKEDGLMVVQGESPMFNQSTFQEIHHCLTTIFGETQVNNYLYHAVSYPMGIWSFCLASKVQGFEPAKLGSHKIDNFCNGQDLKYYNSQIHHAAFALPNYVKAQLETPKSIIHGE